MEPTIEPTTPIVSHSTAAGPGSSTSVLLWVLVAVGAIALLGLVIWLVHLSSRRADETAVWQSRRRSAYAEGAALHDAMMSAEGQFGRLAPADEAVRWADVQRRADDFTRRL